jgi:DNA-binding transcriptional regulator GbsR (MarR family)
MPKTIRELAEELQISKQTIQKTIEKMNEAQKPNKKGNRYVLTDTDQRNIKIILGLESNKSDKEIDILNKKTKYRSNKSDNSSIKSNKTDKSEYVYTLENQLLSKDKQIEKLQKLIDQQQILTLQANKKIEHLETKLEKEDEPTDQKKAKKEPFETTTRKGFWQRFFSK